MGNVLAHRRFYPAGRVYVVTYAPAALAEIVESALHGCCTIEVRLDRERFTRALLERSIPFSVVEGIVQAATLEDDAYLDDVHS